MKSEPVIRVSQLSKRYRLGLINRRTFRDELKYGLLRLRGKDPSRELLKVGQETGASGDFWALKDVSFEVEQGEVVGVIGGNGAGKSTLLKLLTRITEPTSGSATIRGRVGSLLEVGTGFHPELTGRENIYMNGTILGMKKREIDAKLEEIVDFSGVEKFIDTPVKRYSSGMYVRLAFAVAAHLEPEVLLIDEVLAVGDADFQKKCLGKMGEISRQGRTILFVSHNMTAINELCSRCIHLSGGLVQKIGATAEVVSEYLLKDSLGSLSLPLVNEREHVSIDSVKYLPDSRNVTVEIVVTAGAFTKPIGVTLDIYDWQRMLIGRVTSHISGAFLESLDGSALFSVTLLGLNSLLHGGTYSIDIALVVPGENRLVVAHDAVRHVIPDRKLAGNEVSRGKSLGPLNIQSTGAVQCVC